MIVLGSEFCYLTLMPVEEKLCQHVKYIISLFEGQVVEHKSC
jgi:hypothetical protein